MNDRLLEETAKLIDIVDTPLCSFVWKVCYHIQFENMRGTDFCNLMNLREPLPEIKIRKGESGRMCYMLCEVSKQIPNPDLASKWVGKMLKIFGITQETYNTHHYIDISKSDTSKSNKRFASELQNAINSVIMAGK